MTMIIERLAEHAAGTPDAIAVSAGGENLSYIELERRANRLAHWLRAQGHGPEDVIGVCLPRTTDLLVAVLAVMKSGAAYLPLDAALPAERRDFMTTDAHAAHVLTADDLTARRGEIGCMPDTAPTSNANQARLAYMLYTSGSTGAPKGVMVQHDQLDAYLSWAETAYGAPGSGAPLYSPITVDLSVTSLFVPLLCGGTVTMLPVENPPVTTLPRAVETGEFGFVKLTPAHLALLAETADLRHAHIGHLVVGGEALSYGQIAAWLRDAPSVEIVNEYGPTETVVGCATYVISAYGDGDLHDGPVPIGRATPGTRLAVLDPHGRPTPVGEIGELYIGGAQVTRGYAGRPGLTASRYVPDPAVPGERMYRTGDLVQADPEGVLVFVGRHDDQIKLNGHRIEPGEIESVLGRDRSVAAAAVAVRGADAGRRLVAYVVAAPGRSVDSDTLRETAATMLPPYMIPSTVMILPELPLTSGGKIDREALPDLAPPTVAGAPGDQGDRYESAVASVASVVSDVLGVPVTDYDSNIVALGGTSLQISLIVGRLFRMYDMNLMAEFWMNTPTVTGFARIIAAYRQGGTDAVANLFARPEVDISLDDEIMDALSKEDTDVSR